MKKVFMILMLMMSLHADVSLHKSLLSQGSTSVGIRLGGASIGNQNYTIFGVSGNYFIVENLSVGVGYEKWFSGNPSIQKLTLESTYFIPASENIRPYLGVFGRRTLTSGSDRLGREFDDTNSYGYRAGIALLQNNLVLSAGIVQEKYDSTQRLFNETQTYAEVTVGVAF